jgi:sirohydrochlorin ferrochelatase
MNGRALVVAAHGSHEPGVDDGIRELAQSAGRRLGFDQAIAAFHQGDPRFADALDVLDCDDVVVVPLLQSEGWYCHRVLPAELQKNRRFPLLQVRQTRAVGTHPRLGEVLHRRVGELRATHSLERPSIALVGHGTPRHRGSRQAAEASARDLAARTGLSARAYFLDEAPAVETIAELARTGPVIVLPLLIGAGRHATVDLERRLAGAGAIVVDRPLGLDPAIEDLVVDLAAAAPSSAPMSFLAER